MCCGRRTSGGGTSPAGSDGASTGAGAGAWVVTRQDGTTVTKTSEIAAKLFVATHPGSSYQRG